MPLVKGSALPPLRLSQIARSACSPFLPAGATAKATCAPSGEMTGRSGTRRSAISTGVNGRGGCVDTSVMKGAAPNNAGRDDRQRTMCDDSTVYRTLMVRENAADAPRWRHRALGECEEPP